MKVAFFTRTPNARTRFPVMKGRTGPSIEILPFGGLQRALPALEDGTLVYIDVKGLLESERKRIMKTISTHPRVCFGLFDPEGSIKDPAIYFHAGAADYVGKGSGLSAVTAKRFSAVAAFAQREGRGDEVPSGEASANACPSDTGAALQVAGDPWASVLPGHEHKFAILFLEVDGAEELKKRHEPDNLAAAMETFRGFVSGIATQYGGRLWMWSRFGGLVLFPMREERCPACLCCLRILLSSIIYDVEESLMPGRLSFRMALSIGSTIYREGDTGRIVSDALNSIFHLGQRYTPPNQLYVTAKALEAVHSSLRPYFLPVGVFEGQRILRMLRPSSSLGSREENGVCRT